MKTLIRIVVGYICAVTAAALRQSLWWILVELKQDNVGSEPLYLTMQMFYWGWIYAFIWALMPFSVGVHIELERAIRKPLFFVAGAALTGTLLVLPKVYFLEGGVFDQSNASFIERCWASLPQFAISGLVAGAAYYLVRTFPRARESLGQTDDVP